MQELEVAREQLARSEAAAAGTAHLGEQQRTRLEAQLDDARQAVAATQAAAHAAQQRAADASRELTAIRRQLSEAQAQLAGVQAAHQAAQEQGHQAQAQQAPAATPMAKLRGQLSDVHDSLAQLHAEHRAGRLHAATPELDKVRCSLLLASTLAQQVLQQACCMLSQAQRVVSVKFLSPRSTTTNSPCPAALGGVPCAAGAHRGATWRRPRRAARGAGPAAGLPGPRPHPAGQAHPRHRHAWQQCSWARRQCVRQPPQWQPGAIRAVWAARQRGRGCAGWLACHLSCSCQPRRLLQPLPGSLRHHSHRGLPGPPL